ncbi:TerD family protein [Roseomonas sp. NAR14]|uniref:TerD family protein n=1 Tax=Roseomonas acroporae TaxID=2937791 RepID=A0A9X1Y724_9PROT|nr:TerD family protein [Roseomonas acroporae]MCK8783257.1 TerD family protein [Roseomonas acroporae]
MAIRLEKSGAIDLEKRLKRVRVGISWDPNGYAGAEFDADVSCAVLKQVGEARKLVADEWFVFYNNTASPGGVVKHSGDNRTGAAEGDDETVTVDLTALPPETVEVTIIATIHEGRARGQDWSRLKASIRLYNDESGGVLAEYDLGADHVGMIAVQFASLYKDEGGRWRFKALGTGHDFGLERFVAAWT